jgi:hypothetical protein
MIRSKVAGRILERAELPKVTDTSGESPGERRTADRSIIKTRGPELSRAPEEAQPEQVHSSEVRKAGLEAQVERLKKAVALEVTQAKNEFFIAMGSCAVTAFFTLVAWVWSDAKAVVTTFLSGGSATGLIGITSGSLQSFFGLKTDLEQRILKVEGFLARNPPDFTRAEETIDEIIDVLSRR